MGMAVTSGGGGRAGPGAGLPVVATSLNPFGRLEHQLRWLAAWQGLGFEVLSFNVPEEIARLRAAGVDEAVLLPADPAETGEAVHGKPVPRVQALLARLARLHAGRPVILVNSDILPAATGPGFAWFWLDRAPALALTREEAISVGSYTAAAHSPYRGGLDAFVLRAAAVPAVLKALEAWPVAARMCFGILGWDYLLGAAIRRPEIGGMICDSGLLLHVSHPTTYSGLAEFAHYMPAMAALTGAAAETPEAAAHAFHQRIVQDCDANLGLRRLVKGAFFRLPGLDQPVPAEALALAREILALAPGLRWSLNFALLARLAEGLMAAPATGLAATAPMLASGGDRLQLPDLLAACLLHLRCRPGRPVTAAYPPGNLHGRALQITLESTAADPETRLVEVARLFCTELADYGIFNPRLFNWLALSCRNDTERGLLRALRAHAPAHLHAGFPAEGLADAA
jgi:hypothetical protein